LIEWLRGMAYRALPPNMSGPSRINGHGTPVDVCAFPGDFVWVTYAALWCGTSHSQAPHVSAVVRSHGNTGNVRFITTLKTPYSM
jgi:hypothetical protein